MGYRKAADILPMELIERIQQYVDGENIYIPRKEACRQEWGTGTCTRQELLRRNRKIYKDYCAGITVAELSCRYYLSEKSIQRIVREMKKEA